MAWLRHGLGRPRVPLSVTCLLADGVAALHVNRKLIQRDYEPAVVLACKDLLGRVGNFVKGYGSVERFELFFVDVGCNALPDASAQVIWTVNGTDAEQVDATEDEWHDGRGQIMTAC